MVFDVMRALGRRWYVVLAGLLLTTGLVAGAYAVSPPQYNARALVLLLPPPSSLGQGGNPFLQLTGLEQPASIVSAYFSSAPARAEIEQISATAEYEVGLDDSTRGPVIVVDVTDRSERESLEVLNHLLGRVPEELAHLQQQLDVKRGTAVGSMPLVVDREAKADFRGTIRLMILALVAGVIGTGISAYALDGYVQRRNRGRLRGGQLVPALKEHQLAPAGVSALSRVPAHSGVERNGGTNGWSQSGGVSHTPSGEAVPKTNRRAAKRKAADPVPAAWSWGGPEN